MSQHDNDEHNLRITQAGKVILEEFPAGYILLNRELAVYHNNHPKLMLLLEGQDVNDLDVKIAIIAHYCGVVLEGDYTLRDRSELCAILAGRLEIMREVISPMPQIIQ